MTPAPRPCPEAGCSRLCGKSKSKCYHHAHLAEKERDLARWAYNRLKSNVKQRRDAAPEWKKGHYVFTITLEYFREWAAATEVLLGRGIYANSLHVDRVVEELGYSPGNLQPLPNWANVQKEWARRKRVIFDYELAYRRRFNAYSCEEEAAEDAGKSIFRVVESGGGEAPDDEEDAPF